MASSYNPKEYEETIAQEWRQSRIGSPEKQSEVQQLSEDSQTFAIVMPPPNLTGDLHAGHALNHYLMDTLSRIARQQGKKTLLFPGVDHAGLQLEGVINKFLHSQGIDRKSLSTEEYLAICWQKVQQWRNNQSKQALLLGTSADYERELFTLDQRAADMVMYAFQKYYQDGLIYKSSYIVNWSVGLQTALSDVSGEIIYETRKDPLVTFRYGNPLVVIKSDQEELESLGKKLTKALTKNPVYVATVRPETIFGDVAVAIHPKRLHEKLHKHASEQECDQLVQSLEKGEVEVWLNLPEFEVRARLLLSDKVEEEFGTGALKVTPGSDLFDYQLYTQDFAPYNLPQYKQVIERSGTMSDEVIESFAGLPREEARVKAVQLLVDGGYLQLASGEQKVPKEYQNIVGIEKYVIEWEYEHNVSICERTKTVIEPLVSEEFYLSYHNTGITSGVSLQECGRIGCTQTNFYPVEFRAMAENFLDSIQDWCISRDLVWGHRIPVWYNLTLNPLKKLYGPTISQVMVDGVEYQPEQLMQVQVNKPTEEGEWVQEEKILDTWFSSSLWPLTTLGYFESNPKIEACVVDIDGVFWKEKHTENKAVIDFLQQLKSAGIAIYYLSNITSQEAKEALYHSPSFDIFSGGHLQADTGLSKDSVEAFDALIQEYKLTPRKVWYIDDFAENIQIAKKAGMQTVWYTPTTDLSEAFEIAISQLHSDFESFYPVQYMNTAKEIFYLWIVRMILLGVYFAGRSPFENVLITPTVLDGQGKKMSKSLGNGLVPQDAICDFSSDALRLGMLHGTYPNRNMKFGGSIANESMELMRNFGNKVWNIAQFLKLKKEDLKEDGQAMPAAATVWIAQKLDEYQHSIDALHKGYEFGAVIQKSIEFFWYNFADIYVEYIKTDSSQINHALEIFEAGLLLLHPFMPFETEVIARDMFGYTTFALALRKETNIPFSAQSASEFASIVDLVDRIRSIKGMYGFQPTENIDIAAQSNLVQKYQLFITQMTKARFAQGEENWLQQIIGGEKFLFYVAPKLKNIEQEVANAQKERDLIAKMVDSLAVRMKNEKFLQNAEEEAVIETQKNLYKNQKALENIDAKLVYLHTLNNSVE